MSDRIYIAAVCDPCGHEGAARSTRFATVAQMNAGLTCSCGRTMVERDRKTESEWDALADRYVRIPDDADVAAATRYFQRLHGISQEDFPDA